ncbi:MULTISPECIES: hypothetical protein [unclassified Streptomyces]|uniref:hypothetical protein n=1 Tax=unclassified Streptomyces TaxID=2593676 RepID=UPI00278BBB15|nr:MULTISPECIES: hypothetical protein [unclassified Streptomyces]
MPRGQRRVLAPTLSVLSVLIASTLLVVGGPTVTGVQAASLCGGHHARTLRFETGRTVLYKSRGYVCAVTYAKRAGHRRAMSVSVQARGNLAVADKGRYTRHAGPVTVHAGHRCVRVKGSVGSKSVRTGWILC